MAINSLKYTKYGDNVRVGTHFNANTGEDEEIVQQWTGSQWETKRTFGHMSDDFAITNTREYAQALARQNIGGH